jgi:hypothetical protein
MTKSEFERMLIEKTLNVDFYLIRKDWSKELQYEFKKSMKKLRKISGPNIRAAKKLADEFYR